MRRRTRRNTAAVASIALAAMAQGQATTNPDAKANPPQPVGPSGARFEPDLTKWWNSAVFYQIFVRSFADATKGPWANDGIGDFDGLIERLDYLNDGDDSTTTDLGVNAIWLMPMMESPSYHGYDIADYKAVDREYGDMDAFKRFMAEAKKRKIRVILDLVPNHCSWEHPWFVEAMKAGGRNRDWFVWNSEKPAWKGPWNQEVWHPWPREGEGKAAGYYYGIFYKGMPDLNFRNPEVTAAMHDVVRWWMLPENGGVDGYRIDAVRHLIEEGTQQESTGATHAWLKDFYRFYKGVSKDAFTVGEVWAETEQVIPYIGDELDSCFEFHTAYATIDAINEGSREKLDRQWEVNLSRYPRGQYSTFLSNHDMERVMSRFGGGDASTKDSPVEAWAKMRVAATLLLTSPGIPFLYYGEEIGMVGKKPDEDLRTPMQWGEGGAGFSERKPWRALNADASKKHVAAQEKDPKSLLNHYKTLIRLRREHPALGVGTMALVETGSAKVYAFTREHEGAKYVIVANLSERYERSFGLKLPTGFAAEGAKAMDLLTGRAVAAVAKTPTYKPMNELSPRGVWVLRIEK
jgi:glycosidase